MSEERPNILITNDDGIKSIGLSIVEMFFAKYGNTYVVAPAEHQSASSTSISINKKDGLKVDKYCDFRYAVHGTPADCVAWGLNNLDVKIDIVVSGCNKGFNISTDTIYSGTVGAAHQAHMLGYSSIAISAHENLTNLEDQLENIYQYLIKNELISKDYILNINIPPTSEVKGIKITTLAKLEQHIKYKNIGDIYFYGGRECDYKPDENSDYNAIKNGFISITPLKSTTFYDDAYEKLVKLNKD